MTGDVVASRQPPTLVVRVWGGPPDDWDPVGHDWIDVTCDLRALDIARGRAHLLDAFQAGTATLTLANFDDRYSAWNENGVWGASGKFMTDVPIWVAVQWYGTTSADDREESLFWGTTDSVNDSWPNGGTDALVTVVATDGFKYLTRAEALPLALPVGQGEHSGARIQRWLTLAQWWQPTDVATGTTTLMATTLDGDALSGCQLTEFNEGGYLYVDADGVLVFRDRNAIQDQPRMAAVQARFLDQHPLGAQTVPWCCYSDITPAADESLVYNVAALAATGRVPQVSSNPDSVEWFGPRSYNRSDLVLDQDADVLALSQLIVLEHAHNERRIDAVSIHPSRADDASDAWWIAASTKLLDRIYVERHMPGGHMLAEELLVQGITHSITATGTAVPENWSVTFATTMAIDIGSDWDAEVDADNGWDRSDWAV